MSQKKQGFVFGALILMLSNIIVKVVGALFKIPLANVIGDQAMGYFSSAYAIYSMCFLISTAGLPVAISRMIASARARNNVKESDRIYKVSLFLFILIGLLGSSILFFGAGKFAELSKTPGLVICIQTISPIMFFICLVSCFRGYFQGHQNMVPTAISQVIEVMSNLILGLSAGIFASKNGYSAPVIASFALGGITLGVVLSAFYMAFAKSVAKKDRETGLCDKVRSKRELAKELVAIAIPITISSSIMSLTSVIDSIMAVGRLSDTGVGVNYFPVEKASEVAISLYGAYQAKAVTFFNLPTTIITPFAISIIPAISGFDAEKDKKSIQKTIDFTFRIVSVICLPCAFGLGVMAKPIISLLFQSSPIFKNALGHIFYSNDVAAPMLSILAPAIVFSGLITVSAAVLQASGHERKSIVSTCCGVAMKALAVWLLVGIPFIGHYGIALSTLLCYLVMFCFNMFFLSHYLDYHLSIRKILLKPFLSALLCGITAGVSYFALCLILPDSLSAICAIGLAALVYVFALFRMKGLSEEDILMLPKGETILKILKKVCLFKA